jgi:hypothetical protein
LCAVLGDFDCVVGGVKRLISVIEDGDVRSVDEEPYRSKTGGGDA